MFNKKGKKKETDDNKKTIDVNITHELKLPDEIEIETEPTPSDAVEWDDDVQMIDEFWEVHLDHIRTIAIVGGPGSGKTCLAWKVLSNYRGDKPIFIYKYPKPELLRELNRKHKRNFRNLTMMSEIARLDNSVLYIDEPQLVIGDGNRDKKTFQDILTVARHLDITVIISTCDTRWLSASVEFFIQAWCVKDIEYTLAKRGSLVQKIIRDNSTIRNADFFLPRNQYLFYSREYYPFNGKYTFKPPYFWSDAISKPFKNSKKQRVIAKNVIGYRKPDFVSQ